MSVAEFVNVSEVETLPEAGGATLPSQFAVSLQFPVALAFQV